VQPQPGSAPRMRSVSSPVFRRVNTASAVAPRINVPTSTSDAAVSVTGAAEISPHAKPASPDNPIASHKTLAARMK
jgi:hypothetical protein